MTAAHTAVRLHFIKEEAKTLSAKNAWPEFNKSSPLVRYTQINFKQKLSTRCLRHNYQLQRVKPLAKPWRKFTEATVTRYRPILQ
ncbi:hypothetical protein O9929_18595 [Vibrio lentus]|nr:hypothetical protein [Vibrio lentus]